MLPPGRGWCRVCTSHRRLHLFREAAGRKGISEGTAVKCIIHIGFMKTGTTTVQEFFHDNRRQMLRHGVNYMDMESSNHSWEVMKAYRGCLDASEEDDGSRAPVPGGGRGRVNASRRRIIRALEENGSPIFLISGEGIPTLSGGEVGCFLEDVSARFSEVAVVVYVREILSYTRSVISEFVKKGRGTLAQEMGQFERDPVNCLKYRLKIERFLEHVEEGQVICREFAPGRMKGGDAVVDFVDAAGLPGEILGHYTPQRYNESPSHMALLVYSKLFETFRSDPRASGGIDGLELENELRYLLDRFRATEFRLPRRLAVRIYEAMEEELAWFRDRFGIDFRMADNLPELDDDALVLANVYAGRLTDAVIRHLVTGEMGFEEFSRTVQMLWARHSGVRTPSVELVQSLSRILLLTKDAQQEPRTPGHVPKSDPGPASLS